MQSVKTNDSAPQMFGSVARVKCPLFLTKLGPIDMVLIPNRCRASFSFEIDFKSRRNKVRFELEMNGSDLKLWRLSHE
jgi:hypothetical protein